MLPTHWICSSLELSSFINYNIQIVPLVEYDYLVRLWTQICPNKDNSNKGDDENYPGGCGDSHGDQAASNVLFLQNLFHRMQTAIKDSIISLGKMQMIIDNLQPNQQNPQSHKKPQTQNVVLLHLQVLLNPTIHLIMAHQLVSRYTIKLILSSPTSLMLIQQELSPFVKNTGSKPIT